MAHVLVVDSGVGGLSIAREILRYASCQRLSFVSDAAYFPYGNKSVSALEDIVLSLLRQSLDQLVPDVIVIACNTASTRVLDQLRLETAIPIVGVVPAIKPAGQLTKTGTFAVLATPNTVASDYLADLKQKVCPSANMMTLASLELVDIAERYVRNRERNCQNQISRELEKRLSESEGIEAIDVVVLACTHFPLLLNDLQQILPQVIGHPVTLVDSGIGVALQVGRIIEQVCPNNVPSSFPKLQFYHRARVDMPLQHQPFARQYFQYLTAPYSVF